MAVSTTTSRILTEEQRASWAEHGWLHVPQVFSPDELAELDRELEVLLETWAMQDAAWIGPWRKVLMDEETDRRTKLLALHDLQLYSSAWARALVASRLPVVVADLLGPNVELHHSTLHVKPPETGAPFPMHQDWAFFDHDERYVDTLVHLDDTNDENGCIRFLDGSHKGGQLPHIVETPEGPCTPHLPTDKYRLEETTPVPARRGDVVCFSLFTIHGSYVNRTNQMRRIVRAGYRDPENIQIDGQSLGRAGPMVMGIRPRAAGAEHLPLS